MKIPFSVYDFFGYLASGFLVLCAAQYAFLGRTVIDQDLKAGAATFYLLLAYIIGQIVAGPSSSLLEGVILRGWLRSPEETLFEAARQPGETTPWRERLFPGFCEPFPPGTQERVMAVAQADGINEAGRDLFLHAHEVAKQDKTTLERLSTFLNLYGFSRNISMGLIVSAVLLIVGALADFRHWTQIDNLKLAWAGAALAGAVGMFYRYLKFFKHYTTEVFVFYAERKPGPPAQGQA